jgi:hypothetical protein
MNFLAKILISLTAPVAFLYHIWFPVHKKLAYALPLGSYSDMDFEAPFQYFHVMTVFAKKFIALNLMKLSHFDLDKRKL